MSYPPRRGLMPFGLARVRGDSMLPTLRPGDRLLISYRSKVRHGDVVVARFADGTVAVKRAKERRSTISGDGGWWLLSDNLSAGVDSRHRGLVSDEDVLARVICRVWPCPRRT